MEIVITYPEIKKRLLLERKRLINQKIMTMDEFISKTLFTYDERAIYYLINKYNIRYDIAITYLKNMIYVNDTTMLSTLKKDLINHNLLICNDFVNNLKNTKITVYRYPLNKFEKSILSNYDYVEKNVQLKNKKYDVYEFNSIEEEVNYIANKIIELINNGVDINKIKLMNIDDEYKEYVLRIFKFYNIPIEVSYTLYSNPSAIKFINDLKLVRNKEKAISLVENSYIKKQIINILNDYSFINDIDDKFIDIIESTMKNTNLIYKKYQNKIEIINHINEGDYIFLLGFNDAYPKYYKDEDYFSDKIKQQLNIDTSIEKNNILEQELINEFNVANITFTYSKKTSSGEFQISSISTNLDYELKTIDYKNYNHSNIYNKLLLAKFLDEKNKYNIIDKSLNKLYFNYKSMDYKKYDNQFTYIDKSSLYEFLNNKLTLSYSSIDNFYKCQFRFYLNNILKITPYEETFAIKIGKIFHSVLEKYNVENFNYDEVYNEELSKYEFDAKEKIFLDKLKNDLLFIITTINKQNKYSKLTEELHEKKVFVNKDKNISITFMGIIDKIKYSKDKSVLAIIDYKTGTPLTNISKTLYGLDMQLPIYLYLSHHINGFEHAKVAGIYLQKILNNEFYYDPKKDYTKQKEDNLKLEGYSIDDTDILSKVDVTYQDSEIIKSLKISKNGFYVYSKILTQNQLNNLYKIVDKNINNAIDRILSCDFIINPKKLENENTCKFCPYSDICYKKNEDFIELDIPNKLDFLNGGEA